MVNKKRLINNFVELVKVYGPSGQEANIRDEVVKKMKELGYEPEVDKKGNLFLRVQGQGEAFLFDAHFDTVEPANNVNPLIDGDIIKSDGTTILGADDRAGIAIILEILHIIKEMEEKNILHRTVEILIAVEEETGGGGLENFDFSKISAKIGLCLDSSEGNIITVASPFITVLDIEIKGKSAHAGVAPEKGINAIKIAADAISQIEWGRLDEETTCNIGTINGGMVRNAVPDLVAIKAEARSHEKNKMEKVCAQIKEEFKKATLNFGGQIKIDEKLALYGYKYTDDEDIIKLYDSASGKLGKSVEKIKCGGGTDVNTLLTKGIRAAVIGVGYYNEHTKEEYVKISDMQDVMNVIFEIIKI